MKHSIEIVLDPYLEDSIDSVLTAVEEAINNLRKFHPQDVSTSVDIDIHDVLDEHRAIARIWQIEHVQRVRPDLTDDQAWAVLQASELHFEDIADPMRRIILQTAGELFPKPQGKDALRAILARIGRQIEALPESETTNPADYGSVGAALDAIDAIVKGA